MSNSWKNEITKAIWIFVIVAIAGIAINWIRTPVLYALANSDKISRSTVKDHRGVFLNDNWDHKCRPEEVQAGPIDMGNNNVPPSTNPEIKDYMVIDFDQAKMLFEEGECIFIDARSPEEYEMGHIPGAINWPHDEFDQYHDIYADTVGINDCVVVYCENESCDFSADLAQSLVWEYYQEVYRYKNGIDEWLSMIMPVVAGPEPYDKSETGDSDSEQ